MKGDDFRKWVMSRPVLTRILGILALLLGVYNYFRTH